MMTLKPSSYLGGNAAEDLRYYSWTDSLACGHESIDADHRCLFDIAERFRNASLRVQDKVALRNILDELLGYIEGHFAREEALMVAINYPGLEDHRFEHSLLACHVRRLDRNFQDEKPVAYDDVWQFLRRWLRYHILGADKQMALYAAKARLLHAKTEPLP